MMEISDGRRRWTVLLDDDDVGWVDDDEEAIRGGWALERHQQTGRTQQNDSSQSRRAV